MAANVAAPLRIVIVTPAPRGSTSGNRVTALRWALLLRQLGATVRVRESWRRELCDLLIAVHAVKTAPSVLAAAASMPGVRLVVVLAGTDVYPRFDPDASTLQALARADALIGLQPLAAAALPATLRDKVRVIVQSASAGPGHRSQRFRACVLAHLRAVKDPLLPLRALAELPQLDLELVFAGRAISAEIGEAMRAELTHEPRARWLGELRRPAARRLLADSHVCIVPSSSEGGANVISEAIAAGTPLLATDVPGNRGLLGADWPGMFPAGDSAALGAMLLRVTEQAPFYRELLARTAALLPMVDPRRERDCWQQLLRELGLTV